MAFHGGSTRHNRRALNRGTPMKRGGGRRLGCDLAGKLGRLWADSGPILCQLWAIFVLTLGD